MKTAAISLVLACAVLAPAPAAADANTAAAEAAFQRAVKLRGENKWAEACVELAQSQRLDPQFGTAFNLAGCYAHIKKLALAWSTYSELAQKDTNAGRKAKAAQLARELAPRLSWIKLEAASPPPGFAVTIDNEVVTNVVGTEAPYDVGAHQLSATAPGFDPYTATITIEKEGQKVTAAIPALVKTSVAVTDEPATKQEPVTPDVVDDVVAAPAAASPWIVALTATAGMYSAPPGVETPAFAAGPALAAGRYVASSVAVIVNANADLVVDQSTFQRVFAGAGVRFDVSRASVHVTPGVSILTGAGETVLGFGADASGTWALSDKLGITLNVNASSVGQPEGFMGNLTVVRVGAGVSYRIQ